MKCICPFWKRQSGSSAEESSLASLDPALLVAAEPPTACSEGLMQRPNEVPGLPPQRQMVSSWPKMGSISGLSTRENDYFGNFTG